MSFLTSKRTWLLSFYCCLSFLLLFQGRWALSRDYGFDEGCYLSYLHRFVHESYPKCFSNSYYWGVAVMWWPVAILVKLFTTLAHVSFTDWALPFIGMTTFAFWVVGIFIFDRTIRLLIPSWTPIWSLLTVFSTPVTSYVFRSNFYSHGAEFLLCCLTFYFIVKRKMLIAVICGLGLFLTRLNDIFALLIVLAVAWELRNHQGISRRNSRFLYAFLLFALGIALVMFSRVAFITGYNGFFLKDVLRSIQWKGLSVCFFHDYEGLITHDLIWFLLFLFFIPRLPRFTSSQKMVWLWQLALLLLHVSVTVFWGMSPRRYLLGSYFGVYWVLFSQWDRLKKGTQVFWKMAIAMSAASNVWFYLVGIPAVLRNWRAEHNDYLISDFSVVFHILFHPLYAIKAALGLSPIGFALFSWGKNWPIFSRYEEFSHYALERPALVVLIFSTSAVVMGMVYLIRRVSILKDSVNN